ncbi:DUF2188 domain-containing protein [Jeotgalibacillus proteolyticus]|uniref:DUF2188 domain-containing protein n=1 Tax=Jeotgalibacillus proteolyticus TaxID=2082395 RepID=A0A2S5GAF5_9BACL|nr:DUF2188 domain-containing protein [Jeotgalibacillus proteolyticus]PPA70007.1 hypothetical protein C4B60_10425 [Jeotgalibacillus proteolyticus]
MPWSKNDYPDSWKNLDENVRNKAIEIGNALLRENYEEGRAIAIATDRAEKSAQDDGDQPVFHIKEHDKGWQLQQEGKDRAIFTESTKGELEDKAKPYVAKHHGKLVIHKADGSEELTLYDN